MQFVDIETVRSYAVLQRGFRKMRSHRTMWQQQYDPSVHYGRRRKILRFSFLSVRVHQCGNNTTSPDVPEIAKIDVYTQDSYAFVVLSDILKFSVL